MSRVYTAAPAAFDPGEARTVLAIMAASEAQFKVRRIELSSDDTAGSTVVSVDILRITAIGTATALTVAPHVKNSTLAFGGTAKYNHTVEPTADTIIDRVQWNIQVPYTIVYGPGEEIVVPGATDEGIAIELLDDPNANIIVTMKIEEE